MIINSYCILKRSHPREQSAVTTKVVKITGQGREATNLPYLNNDDDDDIWIMMMMMLMVMMMMMLMMAGYVFATSLAQDWRLKVTFGTIAIPVSRVQFCRQSLHSHHRHHHHHHHRRSSYHHHHHQGINDHELRLIMMMRSLQGGRQQIRMLVVKKGPQSSLTFCIS